MPRAPMLALIAAGLMAGCATSPQALMPQTTVPTQRPTECLTPCPPLPNLTDGDDIAVVIWTHELIETAGQCRRMHETCRKAD
jgi:hypothetical protein